MRVWTIELRIDGGDVRRIEGSRTETHRRGDSLATDLKRDVKCYAYNDMLRRWDFLGTYRGNKVFTDSFGDDRRIKDDYSGMTAMGKEASHE